MDYVITLIMDEYEELCGERNLDEEALLNDSYRNGVNALYDSCADVFGARRDAVLQTALANVRSYIEWFECDGVELERLKRSSKDSIIEMASETHSAACTLYKLLGIERRHKKAEISSMKAINNTCREIIDNLRCAE